MLPPPPTSTLFPYTTLFRSVCLALASCATTNLSPLGAGGKPFQREQDEKQIWQEAEQLERRIDESGIRYKDPQLDAYLTAVAQRLLPPGIQALELGPRVKVIQHPFLNALDRKSTRLNSSHT